MTTSSHEFNNSTLHSSNDHVVQGLYYTLHLKWLNEEKLAGTGC